MAFWSKKKSVGKKAVLKSGKSIRRIDSDEEIVSAFAGTEENTEETVALPDNVPPEPEPLEKGSASCPEEKPEKKRRTKTGIPVLDDADDFAVMLKNDKSSDRSGVEAKFSGGKKGRKTKHGIPILDKGANLFQEFEHEGQEEENFQEILDRSLGEKSQAVLLKEKKDSVGSAARPMSLKKRLERYPKPQGVIDLHGYTAMKADMKADSYIKNAFFNGTYTVRIIVGKGLHSEDGPVLPDVIEKRIMRLKDEKIVLAYEWDRKKKSRSGAVTVYLNNYNSGKYG